MTPKKDQRAAMDELISSASLLDKGRPNSDRTRSLRPFCPPVSSHHLETFPGLPSLLSQRLPKR